MKKLQYILPLILIGFTFNIEAQLDLSKYMKDDKSSQVKEEDSSDNDTEEEDTQEESQEDESNEESEDDRALNQAPLKVANRDGYMPSIITPDNLKSGVYGGLSLSLNNLTITPLDSSDIDDNLMSLSLIAGYNFNKYLAAEGRAMVSIAYSDSLDYKNVALYLKPQYEVSKDLNLYSLIGVGKVSLDSINSSATKSSKTTMQFGLGANYKLGKNFKLFTDYTYLGKDDEAKYNSKSAIFKSGAFTTGITYDF